MVPEDALPFLFTAIGVGTLLVQLATYPRFACLQQTVALFILGMAYSVMVDLSDLKKHTHGFFGVSHTMWMEISPHLLLAVMLPILITGDSISIDTSVAKHVAKQCAYLAGPGVVVCAFALALFFWVYIPYDWPFMLCLTMSSILAATDPVAVVSLLKELGASPALTVQIQGESLLNDGTAMVLFTVAYDILRGQSFSFGDIIIFLVKSAVCAILLGFAIGSVCTLWIRLASNRLDERSSLIQISITLCCAYWSWIMAEGTFGVSGVLCTVSSALVLADKMWPSIASKEAMHHVWHTFEHIGNSTIFFVAGSLTGHNMVRIPFMDYIHLIVIYIVCTIVRGAMLFASVPAMNALKHACTEDVSIADATVMCWGGLRGALGLALAIKVNADCAGNMISPMDAERVLFYVGGVALLTLIVNATTCPMLVKWLKLNRPSGTKQMMMLNIQRHMSDFAAEQAASTGTIGAHIDAMLGEVQESINRSVDRSTVESIQKITGPGGFNSQLSIATRDSEKDLGDWSADDTPTFGKTNDDRSRFWSWPWSKRSRSRQKRAVTKSKTLIRRLADAKKRLDAVPQEQLELLGLSSFPLAEDELQSLVELVELDGDWATPQQMKPINDVFLSLVRAKYWASIEADDFIQDEGQCLLESVTGALGMSAYKLSDLYYIRKYVVTTWGEEDMEVKRGINMEVPSDKDSVGHKGFGSQDSLESGEPESRKKGCVYVVSSLWYNAIVIAVIGLTTCICIAISILSNPATYHPPQPGETSVVHGIFTFFMGDFAIRLCAYKTEMFKSGWRKLDASLTLICMIGNILQVLHLAEIIGDHLLGSPLPEVIRALMVLQLLRVHQLFKSVRTIKTLRRMATGSAPKHLAGRLQVITILTAFTKAHNQSQEELIKYFGKCGKVGSGVVARCIVESLTEVCDASWMAWRIAYYVNPAIMNTLRTIKTCVGVTEDLCRLVEDAHHCGAMSEQDADSVLHPLKSHQYTLREMIHETHRGIVPASLSVDTTVSNPAVPAKLASSPEDYEMVRQSSRWGVSLSGLAGSQINKVSSEPFTGVQTPRSTADATTQTDACLLGVAMDATAAEAEVPEAEMGLLQAREMSFARSETEAPETAEAVATQRPHGGEKELLQSTQVLIEQLEGQAAKPLGGTGKECDCEAELSVCDGWSVYTVDDMVPPQHLPGPENTAVSQAPVSSDVRL